MPIAVSLFYLGNLLSAIELSADNSVYPEGKWAEREREREGAGVRSKQLSELFLIMMRNAGILRVMHVERERS